MGLPMKRIHPAASRYQQCKRKNRHIHLKQLAIAIANCTRTNCRGGVGRSGNIAERWGEGGVFRASTGAMARISPSGPRQLRNAIAHNPQMQYVSAPIGLVNAWLQVIIWDHFGIHLCTYFICSIKSRCLALYLTGWATIWWKMNMTIVANIMEICLYVRRGRERESGKGRERTSTSLAMSMSSRSGAAVAVAAAAAVAICQYYILLTQSNYLFANSLQLRTSDENTINIDDVVDNEWGRGVLGTC